MTSRRRALTVGGVTLGGTALGLWRYAASRMRNTAPPPKTILLVTCDTTRWSDLQLSTDLAETAPNIKELAKTGISFLNAFTQSNETATSHAVILSGLYSFQNHTYRNSQRWTLPPAYPPLAERLSQHGYLTVAVTSFLALNKAKFGDAFHHYFDCGSRRDRTADETTGIALDTLSRRSVHADRLFAWVHYFDPHEPYAAPAHYRWRLAGANDETLARYEYDREISFMDFHIGRLVRGLRASRAYDSTAIVLVSDHGEHFGETPGLPLEHHYGLYDYILRGPLVLSGGWFEKLRFDHGLPATCSQLVSSGITIAPTIMECVDSNGTAHAPALSGYSLQSVLLEKRAPAFHFAESDSQLQYCMRTDREKLIVWNLRKYATDLALLKAGGAGMTRTAEALEHIRNTAGPDGLEFYDLTEDPKEEVNLAESRRDKIGQMLDVLEKALGPRTSTTQASESDVSQIEALRSLGYVR
jgi:arylsulfatase A-like enzyme